MFLAQQKPLEEILKSLVGEKNIFILGCNRCAEASGTGGDPQVLEMRKALERAGKEITGFSIVGFLCQKTLVQSSLQGKAKEVAAASSILAMSCGVGVQTVAAVSDKITHPAGNTIYLGKICGEWNVSMRCQECGNCVLDFTGGICPLTSCPKFLLNGTCGGTTREGKCEVDPEISCGWLLIYERLKKWGQLEKLQRIFEPEDHSKMLPLQGLPLSAR